jgi:hypothetical protein
MGATRSNGCARGLLYQQGLAGSEYLTAVVLHRNHSLAATGLERRPRCAELGMRACDLEKPPPSGWVVQMRNLTRVCCRMPVGAWRNRPLRHRIWRWHMVTSPIYNYGGGVENFRYMCAFPSGPISTWGGCRKLVARTISGGMVRRMMSGRPVGRCKRPRATSSSR